MGRAGWFTETSRTGVVGRRGQAYGAGLVRTGVVRRLLGIDSAMNIRYAEARCRGYLILEPTAVLPPKLLTSISRQSIHPDSFAGFGASVV
jgi:hypothetical protein